MLQAENIVQDATRPRLPVMGFSTGGHLALCLFAACQGAERPDACVLVPVVLADLDRVLQIDTSQQISNPHNCQY